VGSNPIGGAGLMVVRDEEARYANWPSGQAQTLVSVGSNPTRAMEADQFNMRRLGIGEPRWL
jgi:hypothetical protein